ncbi:AAA family ATPase [Actinosynnema sp. NPDC020468]|uniref:helix-turn-helix transcriptional regulator n=1 Tax=Actinosynnema sp. NPDC020468 TaxID=3154488 RepID=UPI0033CBBB3F
MHLVGRAGEFGTLTAALRRCGTGEGVVVTVTGPAAVGRTELIQTFLKQADALVLAATGAEAERDFPLAVVGQLFHGATLDRDAARVVCALLDEGAHATADGDRVPPAVLQGLATAVLDLAATRPVVVAVDEVHHADPQSRAWLLYLARRMRTARVLLLTGARDTGHPDDTRFETELARLPYHRWIALTPLTRSALVELFGDERVAADAHRVCGGNPVLARALAEDGSGPDGLVVGEAFARAARWCLFRFAPDAMAAARALAEGRPAEPRAVAALTASGLVLAGALRHPVIAAQVLAATTAPAESTVDDRRDVARLFWHGDVAAGFAALAGGPASPRVADWLSFWYPASRGRWTDDDVPRAPDAVPDGLRVLAGLVRGEHPDAAVEQAEQVLRDCAITSSTLESLTGALATLVYADRPDRAARWSAPLVEQTTAHCRPVWQALFAAIRAETALRLGDAAEAERCGRAAITHFSVEQWGIAAGMPLATLVRAKLALGKLEDAARYLAVPLADAVFESVAALPYLEARGRHLLALDRPEAALAEFRRCGELAARWDVDVPGLVPWRLGVAESHVRMGKVSAARAVVDEQLLRLHPGPSRTRGLCLLLRARASDYRDRPRMLEEAVEVLRQAGDRLTLSAALAELNDAYRFTSDTGRAVTADRATRSGRPVEESTVDGVAGLSGAERRVAGLAARGLSNRQIAAKLYVTVSTVEQHLTRIYRKLGVGRRAELPSWLDRFTEDPGVGVAGDLGVHRGA